MKRLVVIAMLCASTIASAQPDPLAGSGSATGSGSGSSTGSGSGSSADPNAGSAGGGGSGSSAGGGSGSSAGGGGSGGSSSTGSGGGSAGGGSGAGSGPVTIDLPTDIAAPQVTAAASPTVVRLGGTFTVVIRATYADGVEVNLREPLELGSVFEVKRKLSENKKSSGGRTTREWQVEVIAWELGDLVMPGITVTYTAFGRAGQVETNRIKLKITGVLGDVVDDPKAMRGNTPPADLISRDWFWLWIAAAVGAVLGGGIGLLVYRSRRRARVTNLVAGATARPRRIDMTSERALERLLAIEKSGVLERDEDRKGAYLEMIEVIRDYLGARYHIATGELTTSELSRRLERVAPEHERLLVEAWLDGCDLVRYGGLRATTTQARQQLDDARALVVTTTQMQDAARANLVASEKSTKHPDDEVAA